MSAHALRPNDMLVRKAELLADKLDPAFYTASGLPLFEVNPTTCVHTPHLELSCSVYTSREAKGPAVGVLAEIASLQLEYTYLAKVSGKKKYYDRVRDLRIWDPVISLTRWIGQKC